MALSEKNLRGAGGVLDGTGNGERGGLLDGDVDRASRSGSDNESDRDGLATLGFFSGSTLGLMLGVTASKKAGLRGESGLFF